VTRESTPRENTIYFLSTGLEDVVATRSVVSSNVTDFVYAGEFAGDSAVIVVPSTLLPDEGVSAWVWAELNNGTTLLPVQLLISAHHNDVTDIIDLERSGMGIDFVFGISQGLSSSNPTTFMYSAVTLLGVGVVSMMELADSAMMSSVFMPACRTISAGQISSADERTCALVLNLCFQIGVTVATGGTGGARMLSRNVGMTAVDGAAAFGVSGAYTALMKQGVKFATRQVDELAEKTAQTPAAERVLLNMRDPPKLATALRHAQTAADKAFALHAMPNNIDIAMSYLESTGSQLVMGLDAGGRSNPTPPPDVNDLYLLNLVGLDAAGNLKKTSQPLKAILVITDSPTTMLQGDASGAVFASSISSSNPWVWVSDRLVHADQRKCLSVEGGLTLRACSPTDPRQSWKWTATGWLKSGEACVTASLGLQPCTAVSSVVVTFTRRL
jgi:hypothetical protein